jgi:FAD/FMN-containing dehydrogenase
MTSRRIGRRPLLRGALAGAAGLVGLAGCDDESTTSPAPTSPTRSSETTGPAARPGPTAADWRALASDLDGTLVRPDQPGFGVSARLYDPRWDDIEPQGVVEAAAPEDVATALTFATRYGLPVRARSGGHSFVGASIVDAGLVVSTTALDQVDYDAGSQQATIGAGTQLIDMYAGLDAAGRTVPSGTCPTVGVSGLTMGGGLGAEMRAYGLTCDTVRGATIVTADGRIRRVDADREPDLFWALRGGGGGNVGIVTSWVLATSPATDIGIGFLTWPSSAGAAVIRACQQRAATAARSEFLTVHLSAARSGVEVFTVLASLTGDARPEARDLEGAVGVAPASASYDSHSHLDAVQVLAGCPPGGLDQCHTPPRGIVPRTPRVSGSDVLTGVLPTDTAEALIDVVHRNPAGAVGILLIDILGGAISEVGPAASAFPWRDASSILQWYVTTDASPAVDNAAHRWVAAGHTALGEASQGGYVNYIEPDRDISTYYGPNYDRLRGVRSQYDPDGTFDSPWSVPRG